MREAISYKSKHGVDPSTPLPEWLVGLELEMENFPGQIDTHSFGGMLFTSDGSLRSSDIGYGTEAITKPISIKYIRDFLHAFFTNYGVSETNYSERCSTHVHFNVQPLEYSAIASICLLYQTVERLLFNYIGNDRDKNIFCVPWYQSNRSYHVVSELIKQNDNLVRNWQKYSALNLLPISSQGTIEFRHLHGTCDVNKILEWVSILAKMFEYAINHTLEDVRNDILNMNTVSNYYEWLDKVFGKYSNCLRVDGFEKALSVGVIDSKLMVMEKKGFNYEQQMTEFFVQPSTAPGRELMQRLALENVGLYSNANIVLGEPVQETSF